MRTAIVGAGKMGQMIARQLVETQLGQAKEICLTKGRAEAVAGLQELFPDCQVVASNQEAARDALLVFLCVRPQNFEEVARELEGTLSQEQLVVSIITGTSLVQLQRALGINSLVRCSTNIGIESGNATSCWMAHKELPDGCRDLAKKIFALWGDEVEAREEGQLEIAIVGLGSGPAYVLEAEENWIRAMLTVGMPRDLAEQIGRSVFARTSATANLNGHMSLPEFQKKVLTPGGITLRMLHVLDKGAFRAIVVAAFMAAYDRVKKFLNKKED